MEAKVLISEAELQARVAELGAQISEDYRGEELLVVGVLNGCFLFMADLIRELRCTVHCDFLGLSSYGNATKSSGVVRITKDLQHPLEGRHVLVVEDIIDTGLTMAYLKENLSTRHPKSVRIASLLSKPARRQVDVKIDYLGFTIEDRFVVGYGLDYQGTMRNLKFIGAMD